MKLALNIVAFNVLWTAGVVGAGRGYGLLGPALLAAYLPLHFLLSTQRRQDLWLAAGAAVLGTLIDSAYAGAGWLEFRGTAWAPHAAPLWITALWVNFALTLNHCLKGLQGRPLLAALLGAIAAPLSYWAGAALGAAELRAPLWLGLGGIALVWLCVSPAMFETARWLNSRQTA